MSGPAKIIVERTPAGNVLIEIGSFVKSITEDTAQTLSRALQQVAFGEKERLIVFEESQTRPAGMYSDDPGRAQ